MKLVKQTCFAQAALVPVWSLVFVVLISGVLPAIGDVPLERLALFMGLIFIWAICAVLVATRIEPWVNDNKFQLAAGSVSILFMANGTLGGFGFWMFWAEGHLTSNLFLCMAMLVIISVHSIELNSYLPGFIAGISSLGALVFARLITSDNEVANTFGYILPCMTAWYFYMGLRGHRNLVKHIRTRIEKETLNADLQNTTSQLKKTLAEAEVASQAKDTFFASMSHDLQTPMNAISGFNQVLDRQIFGPLNEKQREYTKHIQQATNHLQTLIKDVLTISSLRSGEYDVTCQPTDMRIPIQQATDILMGAYPEAKDRVHIDMPDTPVIADIDADRFVECTLNLLTNAMKYTPEGSPVSVLLEVGNPFHHVHVIDNGKGMSPDEIKAALKPFARIKSSSLTSKQGTGLGLPIVKQLIEKQNGKFKLETQKSGGMRATLYAPISLTVPEE